MEPFERPDRAGWWIKIQDPTRPAGRQWRRIYGGPTQRDAYATLLSIDQKLQAVRLGVVDRREYEIAEKSKLPIADVLKLYEKHLEGHACKTHCKITLSYIRKIVSACRFTCLSDVEPVVVERVLRDVIAAGRSRNTRNRHLASISQLMNWADRRSMTNGNPLKVISMLNADTDRRRTSRALTSEEFWRLIETVRLVGPAGKERSLYYWLAGRSGLRWQEIRRLKPRHIDLDGKWLVLDAAITKNGRDALLPLGPDLAEALRDHLKNRINTATPVFAARPMLKTFKNDLQRAGIPFMTEMGQADRKALRKTFCTHLKQAGVDIRDAQQLMRHSDINLTAKIYTDVRMADLRGAVEMLGQSSSAAGNGHLPTGDGEDRRTRTG